MIVLENINKTFYRGKEKITAIKNVDLKINEGEIFGIIGFSGAGKSTLVRCINLLERPDEGGKVIVNGTNLTILSTAKLRKEREKISMIFQHFNLMPSRTVLENVLFPLAYKGISKEAQIKKAQELLALVDLSDRIYNYPSQLSGGQKQRVAIARALASDPKILLCDEATSALDPQTTGEILDLLKKLNQKLNLTIVVITHEMDVVKKLCHKVAVMEKGVIREQGDTFDIFANPQDEVTKPFLDATSNLFKAQELLKEYEQELTLDENDCIVRLTYKGKGVAKPIISKLTEEYSLVVNILFADVEFVRGNPVGGTVCALSGAKENIEKALDSFKDQNVKVEVLQHA